MKKLILSAVLMTLVLSLTACGSKNSTDTNKETTRVAKDVKGEVEVPANPERIVDLSGASDILHILGYNVVGTANSDGYDYTKFPSYLEKELKDAKILGYSMSDTFDIEAIMALEPDMIVISATQEKIYDQLKEIAPTVMVNMAQVDWRTDFLHVAEVMDKTTEAKEWIADYDKKAKEVAATMKEKFGKDSSYLSFLASAGSIYIFDGAGIGSIFYDDLGLTRPENLPKQENVSLPVVTMEGLAEINSDYIFAVGTEEDLKTLESNKIWKSMPAVKEGKVVILPASPYFNIGYSPIGRLVFLQEVESLLSQINE
ncbi:ferrichrome-binding periplasmic protein precursor [Lachnospiraceae bacterium KM106-2]|nr:ferrichrome-binding periplasmic protein precursor [Lachnospiraceae bacterium KM106-2]